jgi:hypothetical protein
VSKLNFSVCWLVKTVHAPVHKRSCSLHALPRRQSVHIETFIDRSIIKWVQYACVLTMKFQSSLLKLFIKHLRRSIYPSFLFQIKFTPITGELFILWHLQYILYNKTLYIYWDLGKAVCFVAPWLLLLPSASPRATTAVLGPQNTLFPSVSVNKW